MKAYVLKETTGQQENTAERSQQDLEKAVLTHCGIDTRSQRLYHVMKAVG